MDNPPKAAVPPIAPADFKKLLRVIFTMNSPPCYDVASSELAADFTGIRFPFLLTPSL
jgi:hypothetical protein